MAIEPTSATTAALEAACDAFHAAKLTGNDLIGGLSTHISALATAIALTTHVTEQQYEQCTKRAAWSATYASATDAHTTLLHGEPLDWHAAEQAYRVLETAIVLWENAERYSTGAHP